MGYALLALMTLGVFIAIGLTPVAILSIVDRCTIDKNDKKIWYFKISLSLLMIVFFIYLESIEILGSGWSFPLVVVVLIFLDKWTKQDVLERFSINPRVSKALQIGLMLLMTIKFMPVLFHSFQNIQ